MNTHSEIWIHAIPRDLEAGLNYRPPDRANLLKNGGCWQRTVTVSKNKTQKVKTARAACSVITQETVEKNVF